MTDQSPQMVEGIDPFIEAYPDKRAKFRLPLESALMTRESLMGLTQRLEPHLIEYNHGNLPVSVDPDAVPDHDLPAQEVIKRIGECDSWMVIRNVERDDDYKRLVDGMIDRVRSCVEAKTGPTMRREAFVFVSSPSAVTPFHLDEEHNILVQVEGSKTVSVYDANDREIVSQEDLEKFHAGGHRNVLLKPGHEDRGASFVLNPGDALYIPPLAPHWVKVMDNAPSLSLSVTWRSRETLRAVYLHQINHERRQKGETPRFPGEAPFTDQLKIWRKSAQARVERLMK